MRNARDQYLQHFGKIGTGDVILLQQEIEAAAEKEKQDREKIQKGEEPSNLDAGTTGAAEERGASPLVLEGLVCGEAEPDKMAVVTDGKDVMKTDVTTDSQGDVKMET